MTLGDIIKKYREDNKISMSDFAQSAKLSKAYISILERNYNPTTQKPAIPSLATIKLVASAMKVDFNELLAMLDPDQKIELNKEPTTNKGDGLFKELNQRPKLRELVNILSETDDSGLDTFIDLAKMIDKGKSKD